MHVVKGAVDICASQISIWFCTQLESNARVSKMQPHIHFHYSQVHREQHTYTKINLSGMQIPDMHSVGCTFVYCHWSDQCSPIHPPHLLAQSWKEGEGHFLIKKYLLPGSSLLLPGMTDDTNSTERRGGGGGASAIEYNEDSIAPKRCCKGLSRVDRHFSRQCIAVTMWNVSRITLRYGDRYQSMCF